MTVVTMLDIGMRHVLYRDLTVFIAWDIFICLIPRTGSHVVDFCCLFISFLAHKDHVADVMDLGLFDLVGTV